MALEGVSGFPSPPLMLRPGMTPFHSDTLLVIPGLGPGIHVFDAAEDVDGRDEPGHDGESYMFSFCSFVWP